MRALNAVYRVGRWGVAGFVIGLGAAQLGTYVGVSIACGGPDNSDSKDADANNARYYQCRRDKAASITFSREATIADVIFSIPDVAVGLAGFFFGVGYGIRREFGCSCGSNCCCRSSRTTIAGESLSQVLIVNEESEVKGYGSINHSAQASAGKNHPVDRKSSSSPAAASGANTASSAAAAFDQKLTVAAMNKKKHFSSSLFKSKDDCFIDFKPATDQNQPETQDDFAIEMSSMRHANG